MMRHRYACAMKTYVINLKASGSRKQYMEQMLAPYRDCLDVSFVEAVDGRKLPESRLRDIWSQDGTYRTYGRYMKGGEIGCALSHRKCYDEILRNSDRVALILEDDVVWRENADIRGILQLSYDFLSGNRPSVILLTGSYWFTRTSGLSEDFRLAEVFEGMGTVAYLINADAAGKLASADRKYLADDWYSFRRLGISVYALHPHIAGDTGMFESEIAAGYQGVIRRNISLVGKLRLCFRGLVRRILGRTGHFEMR